MCALNPGGKIKMSFVSSYIITATSRWETNVYMLAHILWVTMVGGWLCNWREISACLGAYFSIMSATLHHRGRVITWYLIIPISSDKRANCLINMPNLHHYIIVSVIFIQIIRVLKITLYPECINWWTHSWIAPHFLYLVISGNILYLYYFFLKNDGNECKIHMHSWSLADTGVGGIMGKCPRRVQNSGQFDVFSQKMKTKRILLERNV